MKITLISPYRLIRAFGLRTLSSCLKRDGHDVQMVFLKKHFKDRYADNLLKEVVELSRGSDLIGLSLMTNYFDNSIQITQALKSSLKVPVLWGGIHPTVRPEECLDYADIICLSEGEGALTELCSRIEAGGDFYDVRNLWFKKDGNIIKNKLRPLIQDLDSIPFADYDCEGHYIEHADRIIKMDRNLLGKHMRGVYPTMTTRGCPFGCTYCCNNTFNRLHAGERPVRKRSIDNIIEELKVARDKIPFTSRIYIEDDCFLVNSESEIKEFCERYKKEINLPLCIWGAAPSNVSKEKLKYLVDAGLKLIKMGIQSGSEGTKRIYKRRHSNEMVEKACRTINEFKDEIELIKYDIILDNPWEDDENLIETFIFLSRLPAPYHISLFSLTFYPGTELYDRAKREGLIKDDLNDVYRKFYNGCRKTYINNLFFLLGEYTDRGEMLSPKIVRMLTDKNMRALRISHLVYVFLKFISMTKQLKIKVYEKVKPAGKLGLGRNLRIASKEA